MVNRKKKGWHPYKYGNIHENRLYGKHGKVLAKIPIKNTPRNIRKPKKR